MQLGLQLGILISLHLALQHAVHADAQQGAAQSTSSSTVTLIVAHFQHVAHAAHGVQQLGVERVIQFAAQAAYRDIDDVGVAVEVHVPDLFGQRGARQHLALAAQQQRQQAEFLGGQVQPAAAALGAPARQIQLQVGQAQLGQQQRLDARIVEVVLHRIRADALRATA
ncbi:hypothetical protein G6F58_012806 [Rhizopus delemar]|nr:hypothetical protein G6F58_012806 [Rhizopus delemar]